MFKGVWRLILAGVLLSMTVAVQAAAPLPPPHLGYGMMLAYPPGNLSKVTDAGFDWFKYFARWDEVDPDRDGVYDWTSIDTQLDGWACPNALNILLRVERNAANWTPIRDGEMAGWQAFFQALAAHVAERHAACGNRYRVAFEVWNEPNLDFQWNYEPVDPVRYTEMVKRAYLGTKAGSPGVIVVAGSLAPTGGTGDGRAMDDVAFLEAMYANGLAGHFDAISIHNYGYGGEPEDKAYGWNILNFRRAEDIHAVMAAHGDGDKPVWGTEFGWLLDAGLEGHPECIPYWESIGFAWQRVTAQQQADYLQRAFAYADENWPWMGVLIVSNLDYSTTGWYATCNPLNWFSVLEPDTSPRAAYTALQAMPKRPRSWDAHGMAVYPEAFNWSVRLRDLGTFTETVTVLNTGDAPFDWRVVTATLGLPFTVTPTLGTAGETFGVRIDGRGLLTGTYTGTVTVNALDSQVEPQAITVPLALDVWGLWGMAVRPDSLHWMMAISGTHPASATVAVENTGDFAFDWSVEATSAALTVTVVPTSSVLPGTTTFVPGAFGVYVDPRGLPVGTYTGTITVTASTPDVPESPLVLPLTVSVVERLYEVYLPLVMRGVER